MRTPVRLFGALLRDNAFGVTIASNPSARRCSCTASRNRAGLARWSSTSATTTKSKRRPKFIVSAFATTASYPPLSTSQLGLGRCRCLRTIVRPMRAARGRSAQDPPRTPHCAAGVEDLFAACELQDAVKLAGRERQGGSFSRRPLFSARNIEPRLHALASRQTRS